MRINVKMVLSGVCLLAVMVLYQGCQESNAPATGVKTEAKEAKPAVKAEVKEAKPEAKTEVEEAKTETKAAAPEAKVMVAEPNAPKVGAVRQPYFGAIATPHGIELANTVAGW